MCGGSAGAVADYEIFFEKFRCVFRKNCCRLREKQGVFLLKKESIDNLHKVTKQFSSVRQLSKIRKYVILNMMGYGRDDPKTSVRKGRLYDEQREEFIEQDSDQADLEFCAGTGHDGDDDTVFIPECG